MSAHVLSSRNPNTSNNAYAGIPVIPVSCGDEGTKLLFTGIIDEMSVDEYLNTVQVMIMYGLGPEPNKNVNRDAWDIWHTRRIMKVAQTLGGEAKRWFFALEDRFKYDWEFFFPKIQKTI